MKIIQVATLITPDGAYGGPVRVAVNQTRALLEAGHDVTLAAGASGFPGDLPDFFDGVPVKLFTASNVMPRLGFAGTRSPQLQTWLKREASLADVVHFHLGRDLVTLPAAKAISRTTTPYLVQTHGMIDASTHALSAPVDFYWTRPVLKRAARVFHLTEAEKRGLEALVPSSLRLEELKNGVPASRTLAPTKDKVIEVLFLARLQARKRPLIFVQMAKTLHARFPTARFVLVGPDEGEGSAIQSAISELGPQNWLKWEGPVEPSHSPARISACSVFVLPSVDEPFPMSVLEALSASKPVVITDSCGLAGYVRESGAGNVVGSDLDSLCSAVGELLESSDLRRQASQKAFNLADGTFSMKAVADQLEEAYLKVAGHGA